MEKVNFELFKVHKYFKVKFSLTIKDDSAFSMKIGPMINKFNYMGNEYLKITPHPFINVDITSNLDKNEEWSTNRTFNMNRRELFIMIQKLTNIYNNFKIKDLFFYDEQGNLTVNVSLAQQVHQVLICSNKTILLQHCVVNVENQQYEGIFIAINSIDYFTYLTVGDVEYFLYELKRIDMNSLTIQAINNYLLMKDQESKQLNIDKKPVVEVPEIEKIDIKPKGIINEEVIPEI